VHLETAVAQQRGEQTERQREDHQPEVIAAQDCPDEPTRADLCIIARADLRKKYTFGSSRQTTVTNLEGVFNDLRVADVEDVKAFDGTVMVLMKPIPQELESM